MYAGGRENQPEGELVPFAVRTIAPYNVNWIIESVGARTFYVIAVDAAGNVTRSDPVTIQVVPREEE